MALDQVDKQNNEKSEKINRGNHLLNCKGKSSFVFFTRIIESFENSLDTKEEPHYEHTMAFQSRISFEIKM